MFLSALYWDGVMSDMMIVLPVSVDRFYKPASVTGLGLGSVWKSEMFV